MTDPHLTEDDLVLHYYGEMTPPDEAVAVAHLHSCGSCRDDLIRLRRVLGLVDEAALSPVEIPASFERTMWARLQPIVHREHRGWLSWMVRSPAPLALAAAVLLLVVSAFFVGRGLSPVGSPAPDTTATTTGAQIRERILLGDLSEHLDRSQMVLVELVSSGSEGSVDNSGDRARAEELVADNRLYRRTAEETGHIAVSQLLDEIERVLTEIAAGPGRVSPEDLADVRRRIESRDLVFKVRVLSSEVRERQQEALRQRTGPRS